MALRDRDSSPGDGIYGLEGPGEPGEPGVGDQAGEYPGLKPLASEAALGEKPAAPGVIPLPAGERNVPLKPELEPVFSRLSISEQVGELSGRREARKVNL